MAASLILNGDDLGTSHAANEAIFADLREGLLTSATVMVCGPWAKDAANRWDGEDVGVHLTLTSEWDGCRWGPITRSPSLFDNEGFFPRTLEEMWERAEPADVRAETSAQIERALEWGIDITHLDSHMGVHQQHPGFFETYLEVAIEFALPVRLGTGGAKARLGLDGREAAASVGVATPDHLLHPGVGARTVLDQGLEQFSQGITEVIFHPAADTPELRAMSGDWERRVDDHALLQPGSDLATRLAGLGLERVGYRSLREQMRAV